jgi:hypothetical protein
MTERPPVSGSQAGHCRAEIWLAAHGAAQEPVLPHVQRTFDLGHIVEQTMFGGIAEKALDGHLEPMPAWWPEIGEIMDYSTGEIIKTSEWEVRDRQDEVEVDGFLGHMDGVLGREGRFIIPDIKTMPSLTWDRNLKGDLMENCFSREYVMQLHFYMEGKRKKSPQLDIKEAVLINFNKENSKVAARFVGYDPGLVAEMKERLSWARKEKAPEPDWAWERGKPIPLRCGYCGFRNACATQRGQAIVMQAVKGQPKWIVQ